MTPLETLIDQQAKLLRKMEQLMARDPEKEFGNVEGAVGVDFRKCTSSRIDVYAVVPTNGLVISTQLYARQIMVEFYGIFTTASTPLFGSTQALKLEFSQNGNKWSDPYYVAPTVINSQIYDPSAANLIETMVTYRHTFNLFMRQVRLGCAIYNGAGIYSANAFASTFNRYGALTVAFLGD